MKLEHHEIAQRLTGVASEVYRELGCGFEFDIYLEAIQVELHCQGLRAELGPPRTTAPDSQNPRLRADLIVENDILVELNIVKAPVETPRSLDSHLLNASRSGNAPAGVLINFSRTKWSVS